jgi:hypothetical protein
MSIEAPIPQLNPQLNRIAYCLLNQYTDSGSSTNMHLQYQQQRMHPQQPQHQQRQSQPQPQQHLYHQLQLPIDPVAVILANQTKLLSPFWQTTKESSEGSEDPGLECSGKEEVDQRAKQRRKKRAVYEKFRYHNNPCYKEQQKKLSKLRYVKARDAKKAAKQGDSVPLKVDRAKMCAKSRRRRANLSIQKMNQYRENDRLAKARLAEARRCESKLLPAPVTPPPPPPPTPATTTPPTQMSTSRTGTAALPLQPKKTTVNKSQAEQRSMRTRSILLLETSGISSLYHKRKAPSNPTEVGPKKQTKLDHFVVHEDSRTRTCARVAVARTRITPPGALAALSTLDGFTRRTSQRIKKKKRIIRQESRGATGKKDTKKDTRKAEVSANPTEVQVRPKKQTKLNHFVVHEDSRTRTRARTPPGALAGNAHVARVSTIQVKLDGFTRRTSQRTSQRIKNEKRIIRQESRATGKKDTTRKAEVSASKGTLMPGVGYVKLKQAVTKLVRLSWWP